MITTRRRRVGVEFDLLPRFSPSQLLFFDEHPSRYPTRRSGDLQGRQLTPVAVSLCTYVYAKAVLFVSLCHPSFPLVPRLVAPQTNADMIVPTVFLACGLASMASASLYVTAPVGSTTCTGDAKCVRPEPAPRVPPS